MVITDARKALGMSQVELADALGVNQATVSRFETGDLEPNARTILAIEALLQRRGPTPESAAA